MLRSWVSIYSYDKARRLGVENTQENQDAPENILDDTRKVSGRILGLTSGDGNRLGAAICFRSISWFVFISLGKENPHAKAAVTKTDAKPPIPS
jgi:hypothetical protein